MSYKKLKNGKYSVCIQLKNSRVSIGHSLTMIDAWKTERAALRQVEYLKGINLDNCGKYEPRFEHQ